MARNAPPPGESKTPIIVALVMFVLFTLGLGVLYYMSFENVTKAEEAKKQADTEKAGMEKKLRAEQDKVKMYRVLIGVGTEADVTAIKDTTEKAEVSAEYKVATGKLDQLVQGYRDIESGAMPGTPFNPSKADVFVWPEGDADTFDKAPAKPLFAVVVNKMAGQLLATRRQATAEASRKAAEESYTKLGQQYQATIKNLTDVAAKFPGELQAEVAKIKTNYDAATANFVAESAKANTQVKDFDVAREDAVIKAAQERAAREKLQKEVERMRLDEAASQDPFGANTDQPHGKITRKRDNVVDVNLGSADNVRPGLTFTVQPSDTRTRGIDSRKVVRKMPNGETTTVIRNKGTIEILDVIGPNVSTARIVTQDDPIRDAILPGDLLYNAAWRKGAADHVALFGVFDMDADGVDDIKTLVRDLNRVGVVVDAYFDLTRGEWNGKVNKQTAFAIEGYYPQQVAADGLAAAKTAVNNKLEAAKKTVLGEGIKVVKARDFFPRTGYKMRLDITQDTINRAYNPYLSAGPTPAPAGDADPK